MKTISRVKNKIVQAFRKKVGQKPTRSLARNLTPRARIRKD